MPALKLLSDEPVQVHDPDREDDRERYAEQKYNGANAHQQLATFYLHAAASLTMFPTVST
jgi:hypothetical protein